MSNFIKSLTKISGNEDILINFLGYYFDYFSNDNISQILKDFPDFKNKRNLLKYAKNEYNKVVRRINKDELNSKIINPLTNRKVKKYNILKKDGKIRGKYKYLLKFDEKQKLIINNTIIGVNINDKSTIKFDKKDITTPFLQKNFGVDIPRENIKIGNVIGNIEFKSHIPKNEKVLLQIRIDFDWKPSTEWIEKYLTTIDYYTGEELSNTDFLLDIIFKYYEGAVAGAVQNIRVKIETSMNKKDFDLVDMELREQVPLSIANLYNEVIPTKFNHCIHDYIIENYPSHSKSENQKNKIKKINTTNDIFDWCNKYNIKMIAFDINGNVIKSNYPTKKNKLKNMIYVAYNNHLYPLKNQYLKKKKVQKYEIEFINNLEKKLIEFLNNGILPCDIYHDGDELKNFTCEWELENKKTIGKTFTNNDEYFECLKIGNIFGIEDKINPSTKLKHLGDLLEPLYSKELNSKSFFPLGNIINKSGFNYTREDIEEFEEHLFQTIDKSKAHSYEISKLPFLIRTDIKYMKSKKIKNQNCKIIPHYLYSIDTKYSNIFFPYNGVYFGNVIIRARENNIDFEILEEQETEKIPNYFTEMVNDLYEKVSNKSFKEIMNVFIGKFECSNEINKYLEFNKILGNDELKTFDGMVKKLNNDFSIGFNQKETQHIFNRKPIAIQIKDNLRLRLFDMMEKLKLKNDDIIQIKTDSITFKKLNVDYKDNLHNELSGWKTEKFSKMKFNHIKNVEKVSFEYKNNDNGTIMLGYAGCGKSYKIINEIIPKLNNDYRVLTPSHATLDEYRQKKLNCDVIQKYYYKSILPEENNIIVDEIGMVGIIGWNMLYKCKIMGKNVMVYGDNRQLKPVESLLCDNPNFYNLMFKNHIINNDNYRNNFTHKYYDELRENPEKLRLQEVKKYNTEYNKSSVIIAYTHKTREYYNNLMCKELNINSIFDIGTKVICKSNKCREFDIYNNFSFVVRKVDNEYVYFDNNYKVNLDLFEKNFEYAYCRTLHSVQGTTLESFHYCLEDIKFLDGRALYTLISRLKQN